MGIEYRKECNNNVVVEISSFTPETGVKECNLIFHSNLKGASFEKQLKDIHSVLSGMAFESEGNLKPVFKRYFLSDFANQADVLSAALCNNNDICAVSFVQQPPLDGTKVALWVYMQSDMELSMLKGNLIAKHNGYNHIWTAGSVVPEKGSDHQTTVLLEKYSEDIKEIGCTIKDNCVRTWFFVQNVDVNYGGVVTARKQWFEEHGLTHNTHYIASTGIEGRYSDHRASVLFDAYAVGGLQPGQQVYLYAPTHLNPTYEYGVTFERGVKVIYGDRNHIFISGTASIDNKGHIVHEGNISNQAERMMENINVLLSEAGSDMQDVMQMIIYLRDIADYNVIEQYFRENYPEIPKIITLAPVCRPGWLVEAECIAVNNKGIESYKPL